MEYIATFYSHFGATRYRRELKAAGINAREMPVPRQLSSSCGTCVKYAAEGYFLEGHIDEIEMIVSVEEDGAYKEVYRAENS